MPPNSETIKHTCRRRQSSHSVLPGQVKALVKSTWAVHGISCMKIKSIECRQLDGFEDLWKEMRLLTCLSLSSVSPSVVCVELVNDLTSVTS